MKKLLAILIVIITVIVMFAVVYLIKNNHKVQEKNYLYEGEGFGGDFTITLKDDGTASYYEGYLSSYMGMGTWKSEGDVITITDESFHNRFKMNENNLEFVEEGSTNFPYVKVKEGELFLLQQ